MQPNPHREDYPFITRVAEPANIPPSKPGIVPPSGPSCFSYTDPGPGRYVLALRSWHSYYKIYTDDDYHEWVEVANRLHENRIRCGPRPPLESEVRWWRERGFERVPRCGSIFATDRLVWELHGRNSEDPWDSAILKKDTHPLGGDFSVPVRLNGNIRHLRSTQRYPRYRQTPTPAQEEAQLNSPPALF